MTRLQEMQLSIPYVDENPFMPSARPEALREIPWLYPSYVTEEGYLKLSFHALLVEVGGMRLVVDTCIGNDKPRSMTGGIGLHTNFLTDLEALGWSRQSVDFVVCTHLHVDHVGWNTMKVGDRWVPTFPNARYLIGKDEYEFWSQDESEDQVPIMADSVTPLFEFGLVDLVETDHVIVDGISLIPTLGHTPGHVSVMLESAGAKGMITGDMMHNPCQIARPGWTVSFDNNPEAAVDCRRSMLRELCDSSTLVIGTHFASPSAGHIVSEGEEYVFNSSAS